MFALLVAHALAKPITLEVEMPEEHVHGQILRTGIWSRVPDAMAVEMALTEHNIRLENASVVSSGMDENGSHLRWMELENGEVHIDKTRRGSRRVCTPAGASGLWERGNDIVIYEATDSQVGAIQDTPGFLLVKNDPDVGALVSLTPGDTVTVTDVRRNSHLLRETISVQRRSGRMDVHRSALSERMCFVPGG